MNVKDIKVVVFDLDGTLYEDTHHFDYYAERLKEKVASKYQADFANDYQTSIQDKHTLKIGRVYDVEKDLILVQLDNQVREAYGWDGTPLLKEQLEELYSNPLTYDMTSMLNVGDLWWIPGSIARHYGLNDNQSHQAFMETRTYMMSDDFKMNPILNLKETLETIQDNVSLVLLTNSPEVDSEQIIRKLGLSTVFHQKIFEARKPARTEERFTHIKEYFNVNFNEILSVGDNWINEILLAKELGCKTIFINPHRLGHVDSADLVVNNVGETIPILQQFKK